MDAKKPNTRVKGKRVPAVDKCFKILEVLAGSESLLGITEISTRLGFHKSTVFNLLYTLVELGILEMSPEGKVRLGIKLYTLGRKAGAGAILISKVRPFLEEVNQQTNLSVFLGLRSGMKAVIIDKVDSPNEVKVSSELGMKIPLIAGAGGKVLLAQLPESQIREIVSGNPLPQFTPFTCTDPKRFLKLIQQTRQERFALDNEEYILGIRAMAIPLEIGLPDQQAAIWMVGLKGQMDDEKLAELRNILQNVGAKIEAQFSM